MQYVHEQHGVNHLAAMCAIDRATLSTVCEYWAPEVRVTGITELGVNAMVFKGENEREINLRLEPIPGKEKVEEGDAKDE